MELETLNKIEELVKNGNRKFIFKTNTGELITKRLGISSSGNLMFFKDKSKKYGYPFSSIKNNLQDYFKIIENKKNKLSAIEQYCNDLINMKKYLEKNLHPNLRPYWEKELTNINEENIRKFIEDGKAFSHYDAWENAPKYNLPRIERHKTLTLKSCLPRGIREKVLQEVKDALDNKKEYSFFWRHNYDYTLEITFKNGIGRAWLSQEFKNCGNGHYWLVISENHCIFCEND